MYDRSPENSLQLRGARAVFSCCGGSTTKYTKSADKKYCWYFVTCVAALLGLYPFSARADTSDSTWISGKSGFAGYWDRYGLANPSNHPRVTCEPSSQGYYTSIQACGYGPGDWALDYYGPPGTYLTYSASASGATLTSRVWAIEPTCSGGAAVAGWTVFIDVFASGSWEGWVSYSHLDNVNVSVAQSVNPGDVIREA